MSMGERRAAGRALPRSLRARAARRARPRPSITPDGTKTLAGPPVPQVGYARGRETASSARFFYQQHDALTDRRWRPAQVDRPSGTCALPAPMCRAKPLREPVPRVRPRRRPPEIPRHALLHRVVLREGTSRHARALFREASRRMMALGLESGGARGGFQRHAAAARSSVACLRRSGGRLRTLRRETIHKTRRHSVKFADNFAAAQNEAGLRCRYTGASPVARHDAALADHPLGLRRPAAADRMDPGWVEPGWRCASHDRVAPCLDLSTCRRGAARRKAIVSASTRTATRRRRSRAS